MNGIIDRLLRHSCLRLILVLWIAAFAAATAITELTRLLDPAGFDAVNALPEPLADLPPAGLFAAVVVAAPVIETLIFQWGLLMLARKATQWTAKSDSWMPAFLVSSLVFAAVHGLGYDDARLGLLRVLPILPLSLALSLLAVVEREREKGGRPVVAVCALHALNNLFVFALLALFPEE